MRQLLNRRPVAALVALSLFVLAAPVRAQSPVPPGPLPPPSFGYNALASGYLPPPGPPPVPAGSDLTGLAALTTATGEYQKQIQEARLLQQKVARSSIDTRRKLFDERLYENANRPTLDQALAAQFAERLAVARNNPPATLIWSGGALNDLLSAIQQAEAVTGVRGVEVPLSDETLRHINVTTGATPGSIGLFKNGGKLRWPLPLLDERFDDLRARIDLLAPKAVSSVASGDPDDRTIRDLLLAIADLKARVTAATSDQSPTENIQSMRFVTELYDATQGLTDPSAVNYLNGTWSAKGATVNQLVDYLTQNGLKFAPSSDGDESYYTALYRSILSYDASLSQFISRR